MQFFIFSKYLKQTASILHDQHVFKLCVELCQVLLIVTALLLNDRNTKLFFALLCQNQHGIEQNKTLTYLDTTKSNYTNHPFVVFAKKSRNNYILLNDLAGEYYAEAKRRFKDKKYENLDSMIHIIHMFLFRGYILCKTDEQWNNDVPGPLNIPPICADKEVVQLYNSVLVESGISTNDDRKFNLIRQYSRTSNAFCANSWKDYFLFQQFAYYYNNKGFGRYLHSVVPPLLSEGPVLTSHLNEACTKSLSFKTECNSKIFYDGLVGTFIVHMEEQKETLKRELSPESMADSYTYELILLKNYLLKLANQVDEDSPLLSIDI